jgi:hypothetical protein
MEYRYDGMMPTFRCFFDVTHSVITARAVNHTPSTITPEHSGTRIQTVLASRTKLMPVLLPSVLKQSFSESDKPQRVLLSL